MDSTFQATAAAGVVALLVAALWYARRRGFAAVLSPRRGGGRRLECLDRLGLGPQHSLHLVRVGPAVLLVACSPGGCTLIDSRPWREIESSGEGAR